MHGVAAARTSVALIAFCEHIGPLAPVTEGEDPRVLTLPLEAAPKGFERPVRLHEVRWRDG